MPKTKARMPLSEELKWFLLQHGFKKDEGRQNYKAGDRVTHVDSGIQVTLQTTDTTSSIINRLIKNAKANARDHANKKATEHSTEI